MNITDLNDMWVTFSIREDHLKNIKIGTELDAFIPALDNRPVKLKVYYMKDMGTYAAWKATKTNGQLTPRHSRCVPVQWKRWPTYVLECRSLRN
jgi:hypothetical protein